jgi:hypothetical protein
LNTSHTASIRSYFSQSTTHPRATAAMRRSSNHTQ